MHSDVVGVLNRLGEKAAGPLAQWAREAELDKPKLTKFDPWGQRIDDIKVSPAWDHLKTFSATEGLVADGYDRALGEHSRLVQFSKLFLFHPSSAFFSCPLAMTDGAARVLEIYGLNDERLRSAFRRLTSRDPSQFWTSGQWMTEKTGGSDVSETSTSARKSGDVFLLSGTKWFSSSTTSEMALGLARIEGAPAGSKGLTLFYIPMRNHLNQLNGIEVLRVKEKMGTWALPTSELQLTDCQAYPVGEFNSGVKTVSTMLNITRLYNSVCSVGQMARCLELLSDYASKRRVFGQSLIDQPLFERQLFEQELLYLASFLLTFKMAEVLGKEELGTKTEIEADLLRLMTPITKLFTAKMAVGVASETVEGFGGAGYIEDTGIPTLYRDAQVFSIWEGATNVLSLDVLRVIEKSQALSSFFNESSRILKISQDHGLKLASSVSDRLNQFRSQLDRLSPEQLKLNARAIAFFLAYSYSTLLMMDWMVQDPSQRARLEICLTYWFKKWSHWEFEELKGAKGVADFFSRR